MCGGALVGVQLLAMTVTSSGYPCVPVAGSPSMVAEFALVHPPSVVAAFGLVFPPSVVAEFGLVLLGGQVWHYPVLDGWGQSCVLGLVL